MLILYPINKIYNNISNWGKNQKKKFFSKGKILRLNSKIFGKLNGKNMEIIFFQG